MYETHVTVQGRLVADPVIKQSRDGAPFTVLRVAQSERRQVRGEPGQWADSEPSFYDVSVFRALGANAARSLRKGHPVVVHGKQRVRSFVRHDGSSGAATEIEAHALGHDLRWGCTQFTRNGDLAPAAASGGGSGVGDPEHDPYELADGPPSAQAPAPAAPDGGPAAPDGAPDAPDTGPLVPPPGEQAA
jgi:single-strand DNA-binding protein